jgi:hypothetical protein
LQNSGGFSRTEINRIHSACRGESRSIAGEME